MLQLLQPIWLYALTALAVPVAIHLWNQRPGKTLRVGSIALVTENAVSKKKSIKLTEVLLLLMRCLLLACIAVALTRPFWKSPVDNNNKGWVLITKAELPSAYNSFKPLIDSFLQAGFEFHYFEEGFTKQDFNSAINAHQDSATGEQVSYRALASLLNEQVSATVPLYIFTDNYLHNFNGNRTPVSLNLHWYTYTPATKTVLPINNSKPLFVTIYSEPQASDARYVKAAVDAVQQFSKKNITTKLITAVKNIPEQQDWLFWLSDETMPENVKAGNVLQYAKGEAETKNSSIISATASSFDPIALYTSIIAKDTTTGFTNIYWKDGFGNPLLTKEDKNNSNYFTLYTHIDPSWSELPWSGSFPQMMYGLLYAKQEQNIGKNKNSETIIDSNQLMPVLTTGKTTEIKPALFTETKLSGIFWLMVFVLFFVERILSFYYRKIFANG